MKEREWFKLRTELHVNILAAVVKRLLREAGSYDKPRISSVETSKGVIAHVDKPGIDGYFVGFEGGEYVVQVYGWGEHSSHSMWNIVFSSSTLLPCLQFLYVHSRCVGCVTHRVNPD